VNLAGTLILKELWHRKVSFLLSLMAAVAAVAICVAIGITQDAAQRETRRATRDGGSNVRIIPKEADRFEFHELGYSSVTMPEDYVEKLASQKNISFNHLIARLAQKIEIKDQPIRMVGMAPARHPPGHPKKSPMGYSITAGEIYVGHAVGELLGVKKNDQIELEGLPGKTWKVARVQPEQGTRDDVSILALLSDVQTAFDMQGRINEIEAIDCRCETTEQNPLLALRDEMESILPQAQVVHDAKLSNVRARQRQMMEKYSKFIIATLLIVSAAWIGVLAVINVRERTSEIGLLRALGYGSGLISSLILGRALLIGLLGAALGFLIGGYMATSYGPQFFPVTANAIKLQPIMLGYALLAAPLLAMLASFIPAALAVNQDPAVTLRQE